MKPGVGNPVNGLVVSPIATSQSPNPCSQGDAEKPIIGSVTLSAEVTWTARATNRHW